MARALSLLLSLLVVTSCSHTRPEERAGRCPESRDLTCMTAVECSYDRERRCKVCRCSQPWAPPQDGKLPPGLPPDSNAIPPR